MVSPSPDSSAFWTCAGGGVEESIQKGGGGLRFFLLTMAGVTPYFASVLHSDAV